MAENIANPALDGAPFSRSPSKRNWIGAFLRFGGISGLGWLLDFFLLFALVRWLHLAVFMSNLISASTAAITVFLLSRKLVFEGQSNALLLRVLFYFAYTLAIIVLASIAISYLASVTASVSNHFHRLLTLATCALIAKLVVTPVNFLINFIVARFTSEYAPATV